MILLKQCNNVCEQYKTWPVGRSGRHEKRRRGKVARAGQVEDKEAKIEIVENSSCFIDLVNLQLVIVILGGFYCD